MSFYIGKYGHIYEYGGRPSEKEPPLPATILGFENSFEDRERAFYFRDNLREYRPDVFLSQPKEKEKKRMSRKQMTQEDFREQMREDVAAHMKQFWDNLNQLKPKDYVEGWLKAAAYGFSRAPSEKELDEEEKQKQAARESQRKADLISRGIQTEDMED
jgi:hypothetical protein